jgi:hypothetical protein
MSKEIEKALEKAISSLGHEKVLDILLKATQKKHKTQTLTIIANKGVHQISEKFLRGDIFVASEGSLDFSSPEAIHQEFELILKKTAKKLKSNDWKKVFIIPFGPAPLSMQIKLLVYRVCGIESIEIMHIPGKERIDLSVDIRKIIIESDQPPRFIPNKNPDYFHKKLT